MAVDRKTIDQINEQTDIVALVSDYVKLERRGKNYFGLCPFHDDKDPSLSVSPEKNIFKCFSCNVGGGPINFYQQIKNITFYEAIAELAEPLGISVDVSKGKTEPVLQEHEILKEVSLFYNYYLHNSKSALEGLEYLKKRNLQEATIKHFNLGFSPKRDSLYKLLSEKNYDAPEMVKSGVVTFKNDKYRDFFSNRIMFPITDHFGKVVAFSGRSIDGQEPKYYNSSETEIFKKGEVFYHLYESLGEIRKSGFVVIHEGFFDCISSYEAGIKNTIATMGTALTLSQAKLLENYTKRVIIAFDGDLAGVNATIRAIETLKETNMRIDVLAIDKDLDPDDYIKKYGSAEYKKLFKTNLKDQYEFIYTKTAENLNLKNANDMAILKDVTRNMLIKAPKAIKELYIKKLSEDLSVSVSNLINELQGKIEKPIEQVKPKRKQELPGKYYRAEKLLFINMFKNRDYAQRIGQTLGVELVCDREIFKLRTILQFKYYPYYEEFSQEKYKEIVSKEKDSEQLLEKLQEIFNSVEYTGEFLFKDEEIEEFFETMKKSVLEKKYREKLQEIKEESESYQKTVLVEEQREYKLKLTK